LSSGLITKKYHATINGISGKLSTNICTEHDYDLFIRNYFETSHAKGPQDAAGGFLKNQVDLAVYRGSEIIQSASDFFNYCENLFEQIENSGYYQ
jgi:hypothetical protein